MEATQENIAADLLLAIILVSKKQQTLFYHLSLLLSAICFGHFNQPSLILGRLFQSFVSYEVTVYARFMAHSYVL